MIYSNEIASARTGFLALADKINVVIIHDRPYRDLLKFKPLSSIPRGYPDVYFDGQTWDFKTSTYNKEDTLRQHIKNGRKADNVIFVTKEIKHGYEQAGAVVLKLVNMDAGIFKDAVDYLLRNGIPYGDVILINRYGKLLVIKYKEIGNRNYTRKIKGFL